MFNIAEWVWNQKYLNEVLVESVTQNLMCSTQSSDGKKKKGD